MFEFVSGARTAPSEHTKEMLRDKIKQHAPTTIAQLLRRVFFRIWRRPYVRVVPADDLFSKLDKVNAVPACKVKTPEIVDMPLIIQASYLKNAIYEIPEDYIAVLPNILFCSSNNVAFSEEKEVIGETLNTGTEENLFLRNLYSRSITQVRGWSIPLRSRYNNYYHTLLDNIPRLLSLSHPPFSGIPEINLLYSGEMTDLEDYVLNRLPLSNLRPRKLEEGIVYQIERFLLSPFKTRRFAGFLPHPYAKMLRRALLQRSGRGEARICISRQKAGMRRIQNWAELCRELAEWGFETVVLEDLTVSEQIDMFSQAGVVVGAHGSGLANLLFATRAKVLELFPATFVVPHYYFLSRSLGHEYSWLCSAADCRDAPEFEVNVQHVARRLSEMGVNRRTAPKNPKAGAASLPTR